MVLLACLIAQCMLWRQSVSVAVRTLGLGQPTRRSILVAFLVSALLLLTIPAFAAATGARATLYPGWQYLLPGLFAQGGVAEELLFELGARTIWAPAFVHLVMQSAVKVIEMPGWSTSYQMMWLAACAVVPWFVFGFRVPIGDVAEPVRT